MQWSIFILLQLICRRLAKSIIAIFDFYHVYFENEMIEFFVNFFQMEFQILIQQMFCQ